MTDKKPCAARTFWLLAFLLMLAWLTFLGAFVAVRWTYDWLIG